MYPSLNNIPVENLITKAKQSSIDEEMIERYAIRYEAQGDSEKSGGIAVMAAIFTMP